MRQVVDNPLNGIYRDDDRGGGLLSIQSLPVHFRALEGTPLVTSGGLGKPQPYYS